MKQASTIKEKWVTVPLRSYFFGKTTLVQLFCYVSVVVIDENLVQVLFLMFSEGRISIQFLKYKWKILA